MSIEMNGAKTLLLARINQQESLFKRFEAGYSKLKKDRGKKTEAQVMKYELERRKDAVAIENNHKEMVKQGQPPAEYMTEYERIAQLNVAFMTELMKIADKNGVMVDILTNEGRAFEAIGTNDEDDLNQTVIAHEVENAKQKSGDENGNGPITASTSSNPAEGNGSKNGEFSDRSDKSEKSVSEKNEKENQQANDNKVSEGNGKDATGSTENENTVQNENLSKCCGTAKQFFEQCQKCQPTTTQQDTTRDEVERLYQQFQQLQLANGNPLGEQNRDQRSIPLSSLAALTTFMHIMNNRFESGNGMTQIPRVDPIHQQSNNEAIPSVSNGTQQYSRMTQMARIDQQKINEGSKNDHNDGSQQYGRMTQAARSDQQKFNEDSQNVSNNGSQQFGNARMAQVPIAEYNHQQFNSNGQQERNDVNPRVAQVACNANNNSTGQQHASHSAMQQMNGSSHGMMSANETYARGDRNTGNGSSAAGGSGGDDPSDGMPRSQQVVNNDKIMEAMAQNQSNFEKLSEVLINLTTASIENQKSMTASANAAPKPQGGLKSQRLELPEFFGDPLEYQGFKEMFNLARTRSRYENLESLLLLKSKLKGRALDRIKHLSIEAENFEVAMKILDSEFLVVRVVLQSNLKKLREINVTRKNDVASMRAFYSTLAVVTNNLKKLECDPARWLLEFCYPKLDDDLRSRYEDFLQAKSLEADVDSITSFLLNECNTLEAYQAANKSNVKATRVHVAEIKDKKEVKSINCYICEEQHRVHECPTLLASSRRKELLMKYKVCLACLKHKFSAKRNCRSKSYVKCEICEGSHHTLLHEKDVTVMLCQAEAEEITRFVNDLNAFSLVTENQEKSVILPTAWVKLISRQKMMEEWCALIDRCSEASYVTEKVATSLKLRKFPIDMTIKGINGIVGKVRAFVILKIQLEHPFQTTLQVRALVVPKISSKMRSIAVAEEELGGRKLANPRPGLHYIGVLLGSDIIGDLLTYEKPLMRLSTGQSLEETRLGWVLSGRENGNKETAISKFVAHSEASLKMISDEQLHEAVVRFFELPEEMLAESKEQEDAYCEELYRKKAYFDQEANRYAVPMLWCKGVWDMDRPPLGSSYRIALKCFLYMEKKLEKSEKHQRETREFMQEYLELEHMVPVDPKKHRDESGRVYYVPYLPVIKDAALTTKFRLVYNATMKTSNGVSLNQICLAGPNIGNELVDILLRSRCRKYILSTDVKKAYRQISLIAEDRDRMRVIWRATKDQKIQEFSLVRLTYGTKPASYLCNRTIIECVNDHCKDESFKEKFKQACYVDDVLLAVDTVEEGRRAVKLIESTLDAGGMPTAKYMSNDDEILTGICHQRTAAACMKEDESEQKVLGLMYNKENDTLAIKVPSTDNVSFTKRGLCKLAGKLYDPLQLFLPLIMLLRILLQNVWKERYDWDEELDTKTKNQFTEIIRNMPQLASIRVERWIKWVPGCILEVIGFSDASAAAAACCLYVRVPKKRGTGYDVNLLIAKGKLAKIKSAVVQESKTETIPKLELAALVMMAQLLQKVKKALAEFTIQFTAYTDSKCVIFWSRSKDVKSKFVKKKVKKITEVIKPGDIHYVHTSANPADLPSRGMPIPELLSSKLWWFGPLFLQSPQLPHTTDSELKQAVSELHPTRATMLLQTTNENKNDVNNKKHMFANTSVWKKLLRTAALMLRWRYSKSAGKATAVNIPLKFEFRPLEISEILRAKIRVIGYFQQKFMPEVVEAATKQRLLPKGHFARSLMPAINADGLVCVKGRVSVVRPVLIPKLAPLVEMLIRHVHLNCLHASNSLTQMKLLEEFFITGVKRAIHKVISKCPTCLRWNKSLAKQLMSELPVFRYRADTPFSVTGTDLCGHFEIKDGRLRNAKIIKSYIVVFVCSWSRSVHLEVVTSLTAEQYLQAFTRFTSRRNLPNAIFSDNGGQLRCSQRLITEAHRKLLDETKELAAVKGLEWRFQPVTAPSYGGLFEACVRSLKYFIKRFGSMSRLTLDEFGTLVIRIEGLLNSRPLFRLNERDSTMAITPFHFLTSKMYTVHAAEVTDRTLGLSIKWQRMRTLIDDYWKVFLSECYDSLQRRSKWLEKRENLKEEDVVLIKERNLPPGCWKMARVIKVYPDRDNVVRKVDVIDANKKETNYCVRNLVPILTEKETAQVEEIKEKAKAKCQPVASRTRSKVSMTQVLLTWLAASQVWSSEAARTQRFTEGVHLLTGGARRRVIDTIELQFRTANNVTRDSMFVQELASNFSLLCAEVEMKEMRSECASWREAVNLEREYFEAARVKLKGKRMKRASVSQVIKISATVGGALAAAGAIGGEVFQNWQLKRHLEYSENQIRKSISTLQQESGMRIEEVENHVKANENNVRLLAVKSKIQRQASEVMEAMRAVRGRYERTRVSLKEVKRRTEEMCHRAAYVPPFEQEEKFSEFRQQRRLHDDLLEVVVRVPVVSRERYRHVAIVSVPGKERGMIQVTREKSPIACMYVDESNTTYALDHRKESYSSLFTGETEPVGECLQAVLLGKRQRCSKAKIEKSIDEIRQFEDKLIIISETGNVTISCDHSVAYARFAGTTSSSCNVTSPSKVHIAPQVFTVLSSMPQVDFRGNTDVAAPHLAWNVTWKQLEADIQRGLDESASWFGRRDAAVEGWVTGAVIGSVMVVAIGVVAYQKCRRGAQRAYNLPGWVDSWNHIILTAGRQGEIAIPAGNNFNNISI